MLSAEEGSLGLRVEPEVHQEALVGIIVEAHGPVVYTRVLAIDSECCIMVSTDPMSDPTRSKVEVTPTHIKWYETTRFLDEQVGVPYSRPGSAPVVSNGRRGVLSILGDSCESWKINWSNADGYSFGLIGRADIDQPTNIHLPVLTLSGSWPPGAPFDLSRRLKNRVSQLIRFAREKELLVPNGTLFLLSGYGVQEALIRNTPWSFVLGYSSVEPTPVGNYTQITLNPPDLGLPSIQAIRSPDPVRVSRYTRPWVI